MSILIYLYIVLWLFYPRNCSKFSPISCPKCRHNHEKGCAHHAIHHPRKRRIQFIHCDYIGTEAQRTKLPNIPESIFRYHPTTAMLNSLLCLPRTQWKHIHHHHRPTDRRPELKLLCAPCPTIQHAAFVARVARVDGKRDLDFCHGCCCLNLCFCWCCCWALYPLLYLAEGVLNTQ